MSEWFDGCMVLASVVVRATVEGAAKTEATWIQTYGPLLGVALGAVLTGGVALALAILNNQSSDRRLKLQQEHDLQRESQRLTRERLEELYVLAGHWAGGLESYGILGLRLAKGLLTYQQYLDALLEGADKSKVQKSRMELLVNVYASSTVQEAMAAASDSQRAFNKALHAVEVVAQNPTRLMETVPSSPPASREMYDQLDQLARDVGKRGRALLDAIATQAKS